MQYKISDQLYEKHTEEFVKNLTGILKDKKRAIAVLVSFCKSEKIPYILPRRSTTRSSTTGSSTTRDYTTRDYTTGSSTTRDYTARDSTARDYTARDYTTELPKNRWTENTETSLYYHHLQILIQMLKPIITILEFIIIVAFMLLSHLALSTFGYILIRDFLGK